MDPLPDLVGADDDDVEVLPHELPGVGERVHDVRDGRLVVDGQTGQLGPGGQELLDGALHRDRVVVGARSRLGVVAGLPAGEEAAADALGEAGAPLVDDLGGAQERDVAAAAPDQVARALSAGGGEVEVDARQAGRVGGEADEDARQAEPAQGLHARVADLDVHEDESVDDRGGGHAREPGRPLVGGHEQHVLVVAPRLGDRAGGELHQHRQVHAVAQRQHHGDDAGAAGRERAGPGVRVVAELGHRVHDALGGGRRDRPLPAQHVRDGARGHPGPRRHVGDGDAAGGVHRSARPKRSDARRTGPLSKLT